MEWVGDVLRCIPSTHPKGPRATDANRPESVDVKILNHVDAGVNTFSVAASGCEVLHYFFCLDGITGGGCTSGAAGRRLNSW